MSNAPAPGADEAFIRTEYLDFLDELRESGITNMFGAAPYLAKQFPALNKAQARDVLAYWMETFPRKTSTKELS